MKLFKTAAPFIMAASLCSCSMAPFAPTTTARTQGQGGPGAELGNANSGYYIRSSAALGQNFDLGYVLEFAQGFSTSGLVGKYALINNATGPSFALEGAYGGSDASSYYYLGAVGSIAFSPSFEIFANGRFNQVSADEDEFELDNSVGALKLKDYEAAYLLATAGFNIWFNESFGLSLYGSHVFGDDIVWENGIATGGALLMKF